MIKVFVVDDEKLVRRGIIGLIEWEKYGMEVVGDAGNGEEALEFLRREEVDLLFSDLEMPGLSGIPFLQEVKRVQPRIQIVVLTMHQEFELIQQGLRLGILDYITKAQIEEENIESLMSGIRDRYRETMRHSALEERKVSCDDIYVWELDEKNRGEEAVRSLKRRKISFETLDETHLLLSADGEEEKIKACVEAVGEEHSSLIKMLQVKGISYNLLEDMLCGTVRTKLFEDREKGRYQYRYAYPELLKVQPGESRKTILELSLRMEFMVVPGVYEDSMEQIRHAALTGEERTAAFYRFNLYWSEFSGKDPTRYFEEVGAFQWWYQWRDWFDEIRALVIRKIGEGSEEISTMEAIHRAMSYIREHMDREITLEELLRLTGMSKSHFSRNFKKITGKTFVTYLNDMRIESAKKYLVETRQPIYWIASQVGYADEHYFRRIFRERTGITPKQYREDNQK